MNKIQHARLKAVFRSGNGFARAGDITRHRIHPYLIAELKKQGAIARVKRGLYKWVEYDFRGMGELAEVGASVPKGVLCLLSALSYHELTDYEPRQYYLAIPRADHVTLPSYPPIKLFYYSAKGYGEGIETIERDGHTFRVYDMEKTLCDCARHRRMVGQDLLIQALRTYSKRPERNIPKLLRYAKIFHVDAVLRPYLEMLV